MQLILRNIKIIIDCFKRFIRLQKLLANGVEIESPRTIQIIGELSVSKNIRIGSNVIFLGNVELEENVVIESNCILKDCKVGKASHIRSNSIITGCEIESDCLIGPYARIRPKSFIKNNSQIGNFVEVKNSVIESNTKINHLSYIGDSKIGRDVIIGAGCVTCNYDGLETQETIIEDYAFIGSGVFLVAPIIVGESSTIGSGSVVTKDVPPKKLTIARSKQVTIDNWERPKK
jgi:bifunctional UDP-N-acetylglucosamine pyrophosphorylase / glucosamine-1-phosphate N-acetyltransferase